MTRPNITFYILVIRREKYMSVLLPEMGKWQNLPPRTLVKIKNCKMYTVLSLVNSIIQFSSVTQSYLTLRPHEPQHARPICPSPTPRVHPNPCPLCRWCHPTILSSVVPFSSCPQSFPASGSFQMSQLFVSGGQSIGVSASTSVLPMNTQDWSPLGWTGWISLQSKGLYCCGSWLSILSTYYT